jgi:hypothetical protein
MQVAPFSALQSDLWSGTRSGKIRRRVEGHDGGHPEDCAEGHHGMEPQHRQDAGRRPALLSGALLCFVVRRLMGGPGPRLYRHWCVGSIECIQQLIGALSRYRLLLPRNGVEGQRHQVCRW